MTCRLRFYAPARSGRDDLDAILDDALLDAMAQDEPAPERVTGNYFSSARL